MGHVWVGAAVEVEAALALCAARFLCASAVRLFSAAGAPVETSSWTVQGKRLLCAGVDEGR